MENTTNNPLQNSTPSPDGDKQPKDINAELNALLNNQTEEVSKPAAAAPDTSTTPAFSGMSSPQAEVPKPIIPPPPTFKPAPPHVSKVEFPPDSFDAKRTFAPLPEAKSSHTMLWITILLTVLFLALIGGVAYWYLKIYSPETMTSATSTGSTSTKTTTPTPKPTVPVRTTTPQVKKPEVKAFDMSAKEKVTIYIRDNINTLSPKKSSSRYTVTDITFDGPDRAVVEYGNSQVNYTAVAVSYIDANGNVKVTSFTILEK